MQFAQLRKLHRRKFQVGIALAAGILSLATALKPQIPAVGPVWEYASVTGSSQTVSDGAGIWENRAMICYASSSGVCRNEQVTSSAGGSRQAPEAMMMAAARLGDKGWELAATTDVPGGYRLMYFKRLKSVMNRSDSPGAR